MLEWPTVVFLILPTLFLEKLGLTSVSLKKEQRAAIKAVYEGTDVFVYLPTGYGKSLCYQTLPFVMDYKHHVAGIELASYSGPFTHAVRTSSGGKRAWYPLLAHASIFRDFSETRYSPGYFRYFNRHGKRGK